MHITGTLKEDKYKEIINIQNIPFGVQYYNSASNFVFQQDNYEPQPAKSIKPLMEAINVNVMVWPAQSPDLNPIENLWGLLKRRIRNRRTPASNTDHQFQILQD